MTKEQLADGLRTKTLKVTIDDFGVAPMSASTLRGATALRVTPGGLDYAGAAILSVADCKDLVALGAEAAPGVL